MIGTVSFWQHAPSCHLEINTIDVHPTYQRRGVATRLMDEIERRYPGHVIDHGFQTEQGMHWAQHRYGPAITAGWDDSTDPDAPWASRPTRDGKVITT